MAKQFTVDEIAEHLGGEVEGDGSKVLTGVRGLEEAGPEHLSFLANPRYVTKLAESGAGAVLVAPGVDAAGHVAIRVGHPYAGFARALSLFHPVDWPEPGIDPRAQVAPDAVVEGATVEAGAWIGPGAKVGPGSWVEAGAYVGRGVVVGRDCRLMPNCILYQSSVLGDRVWVGSGSVVGGEGYGFAQTPEGHLKVPQVGRAVIGDDVEIGANSCIDRGAVRDTVVGRGTKIDNLVQVGHGVQLGEHCLLVAYTGLAGSSTIGRGVVFAGRSGAIGHLEIGDGAEIGTDSIAMGDLEPGARVAGVPAMDRGNWMRAVTAYANLPEMVKQIRRLEKRVAELEGAGDDD